MKSPCEQVVERIALGEPLGDLAEHAASCASCRRLAALPMELGVTRRDADPGLGFSARMTAGAQQRIGVRHRRRIAGSLAAAALVTVLGVVAMTRESPVPVAQAPSHQPTPATETPHKDPKDPWKDPSHQNAPDEDVKALLRMANVESSSHFSARWKRIERPLAPYRALVKGLLQP